MCKHQIQLSLLIESLFPIRIRVVADALCYRTRRSNMESTIDSVAVFGTEQIFLIMTLNSLNEIRTRTWCNNKPKISQRFRDAQITQ